MPPQEPNPFDQFDEELNPFDQFDKTEDAAFLTRGIASTLGAPVDIVAAGLEAAGLDVGDPVLGSQNIENILKSLGATVPERGELPATTGAKLFRGAGEAAGFLIPGGLLAKAIARGVGIASNIANDILGTFIRSPVATTGLELISGAGAGAGRAAGEELAETIESPTGKRAAITGGEILGGIAAPAGAVAATLPTRLATRTIGAAAFPFTKTGAKIRAERRLQDVTADPELAARQLEQETIAELTPAQITGEKGLLGIEKEVRKSDAKLDEQFRQQASDAQEQLRSEILKLGEGDIATTKQFLESRRGRLLEALNKRAIQAGSLAEQKIAKLSPKQRQSQASVIVRDELNNALKDVKIQERALWDNIPGAGLTTAGSKARFVELLDNTPIAQQDDIPNIANKLLNPASKDKFKNIVSAKQLQGLRSKLLEEARIARADGKFNKARIADNLSESILDDLGAQAGNAIGPRAKALREALDFSRNVNTTFRQGNVGKVLGFERIGGERIAPELTLETTLGRGGARGGVAAEEILTAAPGAKGGIEEFILNEFNRTAVRDGALNTKAARNFLEKNVDTLQNFPDVSRRIQQAIGQQDIALNRALRAESIGKVLTNAQKSRTQEFLGTPVGLEVDRIIKSKNPAASMREIKNLVSGDARALKGLKSGTIEFLLQRSARDFENGIPVVRGENLRGTLNDKRIRGALKQILTKPELDRLDKVANELIKVQAKDVREAGAIISDAPNSILSFLARRQAAITSSKFAGGTGGAQLVLAGEATKRTAGFLSRLTNDTAQELIIQAISDPDLMKTLLTSTTTKAGRDLANKRLSVWLATVPGRLIAAEVDRTQEDNQQPAP